MKSKTKKRKNAPYKYNPGDWDETKAVTVEPEPRQVGGISTSIRLPFSMVTKLRKVAQRKGDIGYQTLIKIWIAERLEEEEAA